MAKVDLDETEASLAYLEDWMKIIKELRAAREFIGKVQEIENCFDDNLKYDELKFAAICDALRLYEEATK